MKLAVIGGGGVRSPFLTKSLLKNAGKAGLTEIVLMDNDSEKLKTFGSICQYISSRINREVKFSLTSDQVAAVKEADFIITTIRSGGDNSRIFDERTALDQGILGQETTGAGGFAMALRSIPVLLDLCADIKKYAKKNVLVFNFTNPSGLVTQALRNKGYDFVYGICDAPSNFERQLIKLLGTNKESFSMTCFGLNHLSWFKDITVDGEDVYDRILSSKEECKETELRYFDQEVIRLIGDRNLPNEYLYFYYYIDQALTSIQTSNSTRGETIGKINHSMQKKLEQIDVEQNPEEALKIFMTHYLERENQYFAIESGTSRVPETLVPDLDTFISSEDEGGYAGVALNFIIAYVSGEPIDMVLSVPNEGSLDFLKDDDVVEITCRIEKNKVTPQKISNVDSFQKNLLTTIKYYEQSTVEAILTKNRRLAEKALMAHPLIGSFLVAKKLLDTYLDHYKDYVGQWT